MEIKKAIETLTIYTRVNVIYPTEEDKAAFKLGIEALKRCYAAREGFHIFTQDLLPGETLEGEAEHDKGTV